MYPMNVTKPIGAEQLENLNQKKGVVLNSDNVDILNPIIKKRETLQVHKILLLQAVLQ